MRAIILVNLRSRLLERGPLHSLADSIWKRTAALNTWGTNAIEGSTITYEDAQRLLLDRESVGGKPIRDVMETLQHETAFRGLIQHRGNITLTTALELHEEVFRGILPDAGQWRRENVRVRGARYAPPRMEKVLGEMEEWEADYLRRDLEGENTFASGAWMHYQFERIHPFRDGNGRTGRLLLNLHFLKHNWPPLHILPRQRSEYLSSLNSAAGDDYAPLQDLLMTLMGSSLVDLLDQVGTAKDELVPLKEAALESPYGTQYLALRCKQGEIPALRTNGRWRTSSYALQLYIEEVGRRAK